MLMDHSDTELNGFTGRGYLNRDPIEVNFSSVGRVEPVEDVHQSGLASSIFSQECMDFSPFYIKTDFFVRLDVRESLRNVFHFQEGQDDSLRRSTFVFHEPCTGFTGMDEARTGYPSKAVLRQSLKT
jgi:hypothetical protein